MVNSSTPQHFENKGRAAIHPRVKNSGKSTRSYYHYDVLVCFTGYQRLTTVASDLQSLLASREIQNSFGVYPETNSKHVSYFDSMTREDIKRVLAVPLRLNHLDVHSDHTNGIGSLEHFQSRTFPEKKSRTWDPATLESITFGYQAFKPWLKPSPNHRNPFPYY